MESRSGESNYGIGGYSGGRSSESSFASESRNGYGSSFSSESALESRSSIVPTEGQAKNSSFDADPNKYSILAGLGIGVKKTGKTPTGSQNKQYNSLEDIDKLIERLETSLTTTKVTSERANQILEQRRQKIESLKQLVAEARQIQQMEEENRELDEVINSMHKGFHK